MGDGRAVVSGLMCHAAAHLVSLEIATSSRIAPRGSHDFATQFAAPQTAFPTFETIECTDNHPIWSADRQSFVPAGELQPGERLSGVAAGVTGGLATLVRCTPVRGPPQLVYNLEVDGEHVYHVGTSGLLVHNECLRGSQNPKTREAADRGRDLHKDEPGKLPDQLRDKYPETDFDIRKPGQKGQDVTVAGGKHPSEYPGSTWPKGVDHGDFKPDTPSGKKTFDQDQRKKWPDPTEFLPYDPGTGRLK